MNVPVLPIDAGHDSVEEESGSTEITPRQLAARLACGAAIAVIDVREPYEWSIARLPGARLIPLSTLPSQVHTLDCDAELVVYCHHGVRSDAAGVWLRERGFTRVRNLVGGIDRWSIDVDVSICRY